MTTRQQEMYNNYYEAKQRGDYMLYDVYSAPSAEKIAAYVRCMDDWYNTITREGCKTGGQPVIATHGIQHFTFAYLYRNADGALYMVYHTYANRFEFCVD